MRRGRAVLIVSVSLLVGAAGAVGKADHMTAWVISLCADLPASALFQVFHLPPPMDAWGLRPLSLAAMQGYLALFGDGAPPVWLIAAKALLGSLALGFAARAWLRAHGLAHVAELAAALALLSSAHLFSSWYLTEFDAWGAAAILAGTSLLRRPGRMAAACALLACALLLKESSALVLFAFLSGSLVAAALHRRWSLAARYAAPLALGALVWLSLAMPLLGAGARTSVVGRVPLSLRLPILEHNAAQFVHLATPTGAVVVALAGALVAWRRRRWIAPVLAVIALCSMPILARYAHYETIYHAPRAASVALSAALLFGLLSAGVLGGSLSRALLCAPVVACQVVMAAAVLGSSSLREDFASRLFLAAAPLMIGLALDTLGRLWPERAARPAVAILAAALLWGPAAGAFNQITQWRARQQVDLAGRTHLAREIPLSDGDVVIFNNFQEWLGTEELALFGQDARLISFPVPAILTRARLPEDNFGWAGREIVLEERIAAGEPTWLYWLATRSTMSPAANAALSGDLSWTRRPLGALTPLAWGRHEDETALPMHNFAEDAMQTVYHDGPTPLEQQTADGAPHFSATVPIVQVPTELLSVPRRLIEGAPVVERYTVQARLLRLDGAQ